MERKARPATFRMNDETLQRLNFLSVIRGEEIPQVLTDLINKEFAQRVTFTAFSLDITASGKVFKVTRFVHPKTGKVIEERKFFYDLQTKDKKTIESVKQLLDEYGKIPIKNLIKEFESDIKKDLKGK